MKVSGPSTEQQSGVEGLATEIVASILDKGLAESTFRDNNSAAYEELLRYRADMVASAVKVLRRSQRRKKEK